MEDDQAVNETSANRYHSLHLNSNMKNHSNDMDRADGGGSCNSDTESDTEINSPPVNGYSDKSLLEKYCRSASSRDQLVD
ncbi:hypothetical protein RRG08_003113 [Elysia crispata]|uniref:Uncharacterized protein n=1 Tax=Elysia crispata TaxID=231223 RepID=A0AAE1B6Y8_9GAST|nr:hypothetical protein RRG08_003113 [Elysia crispata]